MCTPDHVLMQTGNVFRFVPSWVLPVSTEPRAAVQRLAQELLNELASLPDGRRSMRVAEAVEGLACLVLVWPADGRIPTARSEGRTRKSGGRGQCRSDVVAAVRAAGRPLTRKE